MNPRTSAFVRCIDGLIEFLWLLALITVPWFFNIRDYRVFEPDKIALLRDVVIVMVILFLIKAVYVAPYHLGRWNTASEAEERHGFWREMAHALRRRPVVVAALAFAVIYVVATFNSLLPAISFWGSFDRMEGTYTYLTYITLFLLVMSHMRTWTQFERLATAVILVSVPVSAYSWVQHFKGDPLVWVGSGDRTSSTLGNPIFLGAYLLMAVPFTLHRLVLRVVRCLQPSAPGETVTRQVWLYVGTVGYAAALAMQTFAIGFSGSRGPALGFLAALLVFALAIALGFRVWWLLGTALAFFVLLVGVFGAANTVYKRADTPQSGFSRFLYVLPSESGTSEVRSLLWKSAPDLVKAHPLLGCGPEVLIYCWYPYYPTGLRSVELANAAPDRSHNEDIDIVLTTGILGAVIYLGFLATTLMALYRLIRRSTDLRSLTFCAALIAALIGHLVEAFFGIAFSATLMLIWVIAAAATALDAGGSEGATASFGSAAAKSSSDTAQPESEPEAPAAASGRETVSSRDSRGRRDSRPRGQVNAPGRRFRESEPAYSFASALSRLGTLGSTIFGVGAIVAVAAIVLAGMQFVANIQLVQADVDYRQAQGYEAAAGQNAGDAKTLVTAELTYQAAIASYQDAINTIPSWNGSPVYDEYRLYLGKTFLEYGITLENDLQQKASGTVTAAQVDTAMQQGLDVFLQASRANPLNPDHPRNTAKLYLTWASLSGKAYDLSKLQLANTYFAKAASLAPHNSDILEEWASKVNMPIGDAFPKLARAQYAQALTHLTRALQLFPESGPVFRDLGYVYSKFGDFATTDHNKTAAHRYYTLARDNWLRALPLAPPEVQNVYPRLVYLYYEQFHDYCSAGKYSQIGLQAVTAGSLADSTGNIAKTFQQVIGVAKSHGCKA